MSATREAVREKIESVSKAINEAKASNANPEELEAELKSLIRQLSEMTQHTEGKILTDSPSSIKKVLEG